MADCVHRVASTRFAAESRIHVTAAFVSDQGFVRGGIPATPSETASQRFVHVPKQPVHAASRSRSFHRSIVLDADSEDLFSPAVDNWRIERWLAARREDGKRRSVSSGRCSCSGLLDGLEQLERRFRASRQGFVHA